MAPSRAKKQMKIKKEETDNALTPNDDKSSTFQPIHALHFAELNEIWDVDFRVPSAGSRNAWSLARNLNPNNVNAWWYRRRIVAKKLRIKIPDESYELDVGSPPEIPLHEVKEEIMVEKQAICAQSATTHTARGSSIGVSTRRRRLRSSCVSDAPPGSLFEDTSSETLTSKSDAYMRSSSPLCPSLIEDPSSPASSPLPSSSPSPERAPSPLSCGLYLPEDMIHDDLELASATDSPDPVDFCLPSKLGNRER